MATLIDVASLAGVSRSTVSRVLNGYAGTPPEIRERILKAAAQLGYEPNAAARGLASRRAESIGVVVADLGNPFFAPFLRGAEDAARAAGYSLMVASGDWEAEEAAYLRLVRQRRVDGLLFISGPLLSRRMRRQLLQCRLPMVMADRDEPDWDMPIDQVNADNREAVARTVAWLHERGHERIGFVQGHPDAPAARRRLEGYWEGVQRCGLPGRPEWVWPGDFTATAGEQAFAFWLQLDEPKPTAIIAANDLTALGLVAAARHHGVRIPGELAVVGIDDVEWSAWVAPALTTLHQPRYEMGKAGVELLLERIGEGRRGLAQAQGQAQDQAQGEVLAQRQGYGPGQGLVRGQAQAEAQEQAKAVARGQGQAPAQGEAQDQTLAQVQAQPLSLAYGSGHVTGQDHAHVQGQALADEQGQPSPHPRQIIIPMHLVVRETAY
ncbi:MAG: LacI family DNA-binding transcriptional regulator [Limnochordaceae bacterium]|nr:LacI family DNA-binding transcriptional regulator [Limnochordaceae bacterium]